MYQHGVINPRKNARTGVYNANVEIWDETEDTCETRCMMPITGSSPADLIERVKEFITTANKKQEEGYAKQRQLEEERRGREFIAAQQPGEPAKPTEQRPPQPVQANLFGLQIRPDGYSA